jgi:hypothetical protein
MASKTKVFLVFLTNFLGKIPSICHRISVVFLKIHNPPPKKHWCGAGLFLKDFVM